MKQRPLNLWRNSIGTAGLLTAITALAIVAAVAAEPNTRDLREKAERIQREAQELKEQGQPERAGELMRQAEEIRARAQRLGERESPERPERARARDVEAQLDKAMAQLQDLRAAGKTEQALTVKRHVQELQMELERINQARPERLRPPPEPRPEREREGVPPASPEMQRMRHLQIAIDNLHAAGMHELAEHLARQAENLRERRPGPEGLRGPGFRPGPEAQRLQAEVEELRQAVRDLRGRVEELSRERR